MKSKRLILLTLVALAGFLPQSKADIIPVNLGSSSNFAVLAHSTITSTGPTILNGDLGLWSGTSVTETPAMTVNGTRYITDGIASAAQGDLTAAYNDAAGRPGCRLSIVPSEPGHRSARACARACVRRASTEVERLRLFCQCHH